MQHRPSRFSPAPSPNSLFRLSPAHSPPRSRSPVSSISLRSYGDDSSFKRCGGSSLSSSPPAALEWEYHREYGIVHMSNCSCCRAFRNHVEDARFSTSEPSFDQALRDRYHYSHDVPYYDGIIEGRRRQRIDNGDLTEDVRRYRSELDEAWGEARRLATQLEECNREKASLLSELLAERESHRSDMAFLETQRMHSLVSAPPRAPDRNPVNHATIYSGSQSTSFMPLASGASLPSTSGGLARPRDYATVVSPIRASFASPPMRIMQSANADVLSPTLQQERSPGMLPTAVTITPGRESSSDLLSPVSPPGRGMDWSTMPRGIRDNRSPRTMRQLEALMRAATEPGNYTALRKVKALCTEAHQTPREEKTELQRFLLSQWRNPGWDTNSDDPQSPPAAAPLQPLRNNPRLEDPIEDWVSYLTAHPSSWPRGVRRTADGQPNLDDLKASRIVARLRPSFGRDAGATALRARFMALAVELFSTPGAYARVLESEGIQVAPKLSYIPYAAQSLANATQVDVARHFAGCGVDASIADRELHHWAQQYLATETGAGKSAA